MAETIGEGNSPDGTPGMSSDSTKDPARQGIYEAKQQALDIDECTGIGATQFVAETAKEGGRNSTETADTVGEITKNTMDGAWNVAEEANQKIGETVVGGEP